MYKPTTINLELKNLNHGRVMFMTLAEVSEWTNIPTPVLIEMINSKMTIREDWVARPADAYSRKYLPWGYK